MTKNDDESQRGQFLIQIPCRQRHYDNPWLSYNGVALVAIGMPGQKVPSQQPIYPRGFILITKHDPQFLHGPPFISKVSISESGMALNRKDGLQCFTTTRNTKQTMQRMGRKCWSLGFRVKIGFASVKQQHKADTSAYWLQSVSNETRFKLDSIASRPHCTRDIPVLQHFFHHSVITHSKYIQR